jgi:hypothetical protein
MGLFDTSKSMMDAINNIVKDSTQKYVEEQKEMDRLVAEKTLSPKQKKIAAVAGDKEKIDAADFAALRAGKKVAEEVEELDEISKDTLKSYIKGAAQDLPRVGNTLGRVQTGASKDNERLKNSISKVISNRYNGINKAVEKLTKEEVEQANEAAERDTPGQHVCAVHVKHSAFGEGKALYSQHAEPDAEGLIEWYDIMFEHGIEKKVPTADLEVLEACSHANHKKGK